MNLINILHEFIQCFSLFNGLIPHSIDRCCNIKMWHTTSCYSCKEQVKEMKLQNNIAFSNKESIVLWSSYQNVVQSFIHWKTSIKQLNDVYVLYAVPRLFKTKSTSVNLLCMHVCFDPYPIKNTSEL